MLGYGEASEGVLDDAASGDEGSPNGTGTLLSCMVRWTYAWPLVELIVDGSIVLSRPVLGLWPVHKSYGGKCQ